MKESKILKVLEKVPSGTKLYSTAFGNLELESIVEAFGDKRIKLMEENRDRRIYLPDGRYKKGGEVTLYPSREMRDWNKFAWKKGDVLTNNKGAFCIFKEFSGYPYTNFVAIFVHIAGVSTSDSTVEITQEWHKASGEDAGKHIKLINTNLEKENKRLNLKTLEVEKQEFKDGDIITIDAVTSTYYAKCIFILNGDLNADGNYVSSYVFYNTSNNYITCGVCDTTIRNRNIHLATEEEKTKLFNALTKVGKLWNAEKKVIEDIKPVPKKQNATYKKESDMPEHKLEPFEKVLCRDYKDSVWDVDFFGFKVKNETETSFIYRCVGNIYKYCIPYKGNEHLLGTSKDPED